MSQLDRNADKLRTRGIKQNLQMIYNQSFGDFSSTRSRYNTVKNIVKDSQIKSIKIN